MSLKLKNILLTVLYTAVFVLLNVGPCWAEAQAQTSQPHQHTSQIQKQHAHGHQHSQLTQNDCTHEESCPESEEHCCSKLAQKWPTLSQNSIEFDFKISSNKVYRSALAFLPMPDEHQVKPSILALRANPPPAESPSIRTLKKALKSIILLI